MPRSIVADSKIKPFNPYCNPSVKAQTWTVWKRNFEYFAIMKGFNSNDQKLGALFYYAGADVQRIFDQKVATMEADLAEGEQLVLTYNTVMNVLDGEFANRGNPAYQMSLFKSMSQNEKETIVSYVNRLREQIKFCGYSSPEVEEMEIKSQLIEKGRSEKLRQAMFKKDRTLEEMIALAVSYENAQLYEDEFNSVKKTAKSEYSGSDVCALQAKPKRCWDCNREGHFRGAQQCPAKGKVCRKCNGKGHFDICCPDKFKKSQGSGNSKGFRGNAGRFNPYKKKSNVRAIESDDDDNEKETEYVFHLDAGDSVKIDCNIGGVKVPMFIDSGTKKNLIPVSVWEKLKENKVKVLQQSRDSDVVFRAYGQKKPIDVKGMFQAELDVNKMKSVQWFYVVAEGNVSLLGEIAAKHHGVLMVGMGIKKVENEFPKIRGEN